MTVPHKKLLLWSVIRALLLIANLLVAFHQIGTRAGQRYRWVCADSGARLQYNPGIFGSARLFPDGPAPARGYRWELFEPEPLSPLLPWNWLALLADRPPPDPDVVHRKIH